MEQLTAKLSLAACQDRNIVPARKHADRLKQLKEYDGRLNHRNRIAERIGVQGHAGMPKAAHRAYALATKLQTWAAQGCPTIKLTVDDLTFPKTRLVRNGAVTGTAAVRSVLRKIIAAEGIDLPAGKIISVGADGQDKGSDANVPLTYVTIGLTDPRPRF